ncbi:MAG: ClpXP protease specificity-enhancing factor [Pararobbsia sp.]
MAETPTKPYLLRALYEWCTDNGYTPHLAVRVDDRTRVPREFVRDGEIVLNVSFDATSGLKMGNEWIDFNARFSGKSHHIEVQVANVLAIYARENGQGMAFPVEEPSVQEDDAAGVDEEVSAETAELERLDDSGRGNAMSSPGAAGGIAGAVPSLVPSSGGAGGLGGGDDRRATISGTTSKTSATTVGEGERATVKSGDDLPDDPSGKGGRGHLKVIK